jgi:hypothetical protein
VRRRACDGRQQHERVGVEAETALQKAVANRDMVETQLLGPGCSAEHGSSIVERPARLEGDAEA